MYTSTIATKAEGWNVKLDGSTKLSGKWINRGNPVPATIAHHVEGNVFIIALVEGPYLKMVKIAVTGETTFDWLGAKYHKPSATSKCRDQETFSESCYHGSSVPKHGYNVQLVASSGAGKLQYLSSTCLHLKFYANICIYRLVNVKYFRCNRRLI